MRHTLLLGVGILGLGWTACGTTRGARAPEIQKEWVARVPAERMEAINHARGQLDRAKDEQLRAAVAIEDAKRYRQVQRSFRDSASAQFDASEQAVDAARFTGDRRRIAGAKDQQNDADWNRELSQERVAAADAKLKTAEAQHELESVRVRQAEAALERAEFVALRERGDTRVANISLSEFDGARAKLAERERDLQAKLAERRTELSVSEQRVRRIESRLGVGGGGRTP